MTGLEFVKSFFGTAYWHEVKWYHFWNPCSGVIGGIIGGIIIGVVFCLVAWIGQI